MTAAESVNEEAVDWTNTEMAGARAIRGYAPGARINFDSDNWLAALRTSREVLAAALPLLRPSDVPHLERRIRESIADVDLIRFAISDPGALVPRVEGESVASWAATAVRDALLDPDAARIARGSSS